MSWDKKAIEKLRARYGDGNGGNMHSPEYQRIADMIFSGGRRNSPYSGMPTLLDAPALSLGEDLVALGSIDVALFGVPMDLGVTNRNGSRFGPRALRCIERIGPYNEVLKCAPVHEMNVADIGDVPLCSRFDLAQSHSDIFIFAQHLVAAGVTPLAVGGDHSISHPILKAVGENQAVGMIHIDAHCDTGGSFEGEKFHHGGPFRNAVLDGVLDPTHTVQIGIRGAAEYLWEFSQESGMTVISAPDLQSQGIERVIETARKVVGDGPVYLSFDIDSLDPAYAPGTGTPEVGGLTNREALALVRGMKGINIVGGDVVEVAPQYDPTSNTAQNAAQILFEMLSLVQFRPDE